MPYQLSATAEEYIADFEALTNAQWLDYGYLDEDDGFIASLDKFAFVTQEIADIAEAIAAGTRYNLHFFATGRPQPAELLLRCEFTEPVVFATNFGSSRASAVTSATASAVFSIQKNDVQVGTITFGIGGDTGTIASAGEVTFEEGDILTILAPDPRDATLADVTINLAGTREPEA